MADKLKDAVVHWKKKLDRVTDEDVIFGVLRKLSKVPMTWDLLQETSMGKCIRNLSSRNDIVGEKALALINKWRNELTSDIDKKNTSAKENVIKGSDTKSSSRTDSHGEKKVKHHQKESLTKESKVSSHHKKSSSNSQSPKKYVTDSPENNSNIYTYKKKESSSKYISYDPHLDSSEGYNPECPDLFPDLFKSIKKEHDTSEPDLFHNTKSIKKECDTYEPSVKRKLEVQTETVSEHKSKKLKSVSKSDQIPEKKDKHKKHGEHGSKSQSEKVHSLNQKKENGDESLDNHLKKKSSDKSTLSKSTSKESDKKKEKSSKKAKAKLKINSTVEFTSSEANFEDCLGLNDIVIKKKKSSKPIQNATKTENKTDNKTHSKTDNKTHPKVTTVNNKHSNSHSSHQATPKKSSSVQKEKLHVPKPEKIAKIEEVDIMSTLPQTLPNYRPLPRVESSNPKKKEVLSNEDAILYMSSKREKTAVYSGRRSYYYTEVPTLSEICNRILIENLDYVECLGNIPYYVLKPMLEKCTPQQLLHIENYNPYLLEDTDELWQIHCVRDCRLLKLEENETYRELYLRAQDERARKLKSITANISASMSKYNPARQVKLAYVDSVAKPPRDVARRQAKNGTAIPVSHPVKAGPPSKATPRPVAPVINAASSSPPVSVPNHVIKTKPKVAPLMAKTLKSMKQCFRR